MTLIIIGSDAMNQRLNKHVRDVKDFDYFADPDTARELEKSNDTGKRSDPFWDEALRAYFHDDERVATLDELYTIKVSHSYWELENGSWGKHIADQILLRQYGAKFIPQLHTTLYKIWEKKHGSKRLKLKLEASEFFTDAVKRTYDHDSIHETVAFYERPLYEYVLKEGSDVDIDAKKLWNLDDELLVKLFREEIYATAFERIIIPSNYKASPKGAYAWALRRTLTSLTTGRSARYISRNIEKFISPTYDDFYARHLKNQHKLIKLEDGRTTA